MFAAEALASRKCLAASHGARLLPRSAVPDAMLRSAAGTGCHGGAALKLAPSVDTVLATEAACYRTGGAAFDRAQFRAATTMQSAQPSC